MQRKAAEPERVVTALVRASAVAIKGYCEAVNA